MSESDDTRNKELAHKLIREAYSSLSAAFNILKYMEDEEEVRASRYPLLINPLIGIEDAMLIMGIPNPYDEYNQRPPYKNEKDTHGVSYSATGTDHK